MIEATRALLISIREKRDTNRGLEFLDLIQEGQWGMRAVRQVRYTKRLQSSDLRPVVGSSGLTRASRTRRAPSACPMQDRAHQQGRARIAAAGAGVGREPTHGEIAERRELPVYTDQAI